MDKKITSQQIKNIAHKIGFQKVGIAPAGEVSKAEYFEDWINKGFHGTMGYMEEHWRKRQDIRKVYPEAKSVISVAHNYYTPYNHEQDPMVGKISRYAWGSDYHKIIKKMLIRMLRQIQELDGKVKGRAFIDTAPVSDKRWAVDAGLGWQGKHSNVITRDYGSWLFLGSIAVDFELEYDEPIADHCGNCRACIDACPTDAIVEPYVVDARKCLAYMTIEMWDQPIPEKEESKMNGWVFGCDICQDVCPWNKKFAQEAKEERYKPRPGSFNPQLNELVELEEEDFDQRFRGTPVRRAKWRNFLRNVKSLLKNATNNK